MSIQQSDWLMALRACQESIPGYLRHYPPESPLPALQYALAGKLSRYLEADPSQSTSYLRRAIPSLIISHGEKHRLVVELVALLEEAGRV